MLARAHGTRGIERLERHSASQEPREKEPSRELSGLALDEAADDAGNAEHLRRNQCRRVVLAEMTALRV